VQQQIDPPWKVLEDGELTVPYFACACLVLPCLQFSAAGDLGSGSIACKQNAGVEDEKDSVQIKLEEDVSLTFALRYLNSFAKATPLSTTVSLKMSPDVPLVVEYAIEDLGHIRYYLAPKIDSDDAEE